MVFGFPAPLEAVKSGIKAAKPVRRRLRTGWVPTGLPRLIAPCRTLTGGNAIPCAPVMRALRVCVPDQALVGRWCPTAPDFGLRGSAALPRRPSRVVSAPFSFSHQPLDFSISTKSVCPPCQLCPPCQVKSFFEAFLLGNSKIFLPLFFDVGLVLCLQGGFMTRDSPQLERNHDFRPGKHWGDLNREIRESGATPGEQSSGSTLIGVAWSSPLSRKEVPTESWRDRIKNPWPNATVPSE